MGKKQKKGNTIMKPNIAQGATLREEIEGKKRVDATSTLRMEHLQKLATWASGEAGILPLGALFGHRLSSCAESAGVPLDPSTFVCHKCESILQPGFNCTIRIKKIPKKIKRHKKSQISSAQNNVVYNCNFCLHPNLLRGTQKGQIKALLTAKENSKKDQNTQIASVQATGNSSSKEYSRKGQNNQILSIQGTENSSKEISKKDQNTKFSSIQATNNSVCGSSKRKRKGWSSLKMIAESNEAQGRNITIAISFCLNIAQ